jgi:catechol 2,3-dioxygenase-like lactoylglutathione lyase family enzyme
MANSPTFKRINLCVADLNRSLAIYRDILGFTIDYQKDSKEDSYSYPVFTFPRSACGLLAVSGRARLRVVPHQAARDQLPCIR